MNHSGGVNLIPRIFGGFPLAVLFVATAALVAAEIPANSRITAVTVYPDAAFVTRSATVRVEPGEHVVVFTDMVPGMDENSLKVSASGPAGTKLYGARTQREFLTEELSERVRTLTAEIQKLEDDIAQAEGIKRALADEKAYLDSVRLFAGTQLPKDLVTRMPSAAELEATLKFLGEKLRQNAASVQAQDQRIRQLRKAVEALRRELADVSGPAQKMRRSVVVALSAVQSGSVTVEIGYLAGGASWRPVYDARADFAKGAVELALHGVVAQKTGEDWRNVRLTFSTVKPTAGGRMPPVDPWFLRPLQPRPLPARAKMMRADAGAAAPLAAFTDEAEVGGAPQAAETVYAEAQAGGLSVTYAVARPVTVRSDGSEERLPVMAQTLAATYEYSTFPRAAAYAYLGARVENSRESPLLPGRVNVFVDGDYLGESGIDTVAPGETFDLSLGIDEGVKVKRDLVSRKVDQTLIGGIASPTKKTAFIWKLTLEHYKPRAARVNVYEALPVSQDDRIKVRNVRTSREPTVKDWQDRKGVWKWELDLQPKQKAEITIEYEVEHPREMPVEGL
jgi:uncharacterized protein (TIGR02231 family)